MPNKKKREEFVVRIGPELKKLLDEQRESISEVLHGVDDGSHWLAGEIIAKKFREH